MAFVLQSEGTYWWPVSIETPSSTGAGKYRRETFELEFLRLPQSRVEEIMAGEYELRCAMARNDFDEIKKLIGVARQHASEIVVGWRGILEKDGGEEIPFSITALEKLLQVPGMPGIIVSTYADTIPKAKEKN